MRFELVWLVRGVAGELGTRVADKARELGRRAQAGAGRVWRGLGERLLPDPSDHRREPCAFARCVAPARAESNAALGPRTAALVETMAEALALSGYRDVRADVSGLDAPEMVRGTARNHRPSLSALGGGRPVLVDVYIPGEIDPEEHLSRWHLFGSAAAQLHGEFHVVVPSFFEGTRGRECVRRLTDAMGIEVTKVWEV
jgi:hypothetical protein